MFTIGEFSRLSHVSARMLRHYDAIALLRPAHVGSENGYRYYDETQLCVLSQIETLKGYGFTLAQIARLLPLTQEDLARRIHKRRLEAYQELDEMRRNIRRMEEAIMKMEGIGLAIEKYHVITMQAPAQKVFGLRREIGIGGVHGLFAEMHEEMKRIGLRRTGATQMVYHGEEFSYEHMDVEAQATVSEDGPCVHEIPAGTFAAVTHIGPYDTIKYAYDALCAWMARNPQYEVCGPAIERYIKDEEMTENPEEYETGVLFPVRLKETDPQGIAQ